MIFAEIPNEEIKLNRPNQAYKNDHGGFFIAKHRR